MTLWERVESKVDFQEQGCWRWKASIGTHGYGQINVRRRPAPAYRVMYELCVGPIPAGLDLDHLCRNRKCVNPEHLEPVTRQENLLRGDTIAARNAAKSTCAKGHSYDIVTVNGFRNCRTCRREWQRNDYYKKKALNNG